MSNKLILIILFIFFLNISIAHSENLLSFTGNFFNSTGGPSNGNLVVEIYDSLAGGNLIYNSTDDFLGNVSEGRADVMLGKSSSNGGVQSLNLDYGKNYYMNINAVGTDLDFNGLARQEFTSPIGNITSSVISPSNITSDLISDNAIDTASKIVDRIITAAKLVARTITGDEIADNAVNSTHILDGTIGLSDLQSTLDVANYTAGTQITISEHVISTSAIPATNVAFVNESNTFSQNQVFGSAFTSGGAEITTIGDGKFQRLFLYNGTDPIIIQGEAYNTSILCVLDGLCDLGNVTDRFNAGYFNHIYINDWSNATITTNEISDATIGLSDLAPTLDVTNYTAGTGISVSEHIITNINPMDYTNLALLNESWLNDTYWYRNIDYPMVYTNLALTNESETFDLNLTVTDSLLTDYIYPESTSNIALMGGNVGIGTTGPGQKLDLRDGKFGLTDADVAHAMTTWASTETYGLLEIDSATDGGLRVWGFGDTVGQRPLVHFGILGNADPTDTIPAITLVSGKKNVATIQALGASETVLQVENWGTYPLTILGNGNVGIGTTSPTHTLNVVGESNFTNDMQIIRAQAANEWQFVAGATSTDNIYIQDGSINADWESNANNAMHINWYGYNGGTTQFRDLNIGDGKNNAIAFFDGSTGNVGIGTTAPSQLLDVQGNISSEGSLDISSGNFYVNNETGNVGIGTTAPGAKLEVLDGNIRLHSTDAGISKRIYDTWDNGSINIQSGSSAGYGSGINISGRSYDTPGIQFFTQDTERMRIVDDTGNVGIGTADPSAHHDSADNLVIAEAGNVGLTIFTNTLGANSGNIFFEDSVGSPSGAITYDHSTDDLHFAAGGANTMYIKGGNVGIGTTAPTHALNVVGDANITGDLYVAGNNMTTPDYVFEKDYSLMSLPELSEYIKSNNQLPPSIIQGNFTMDGSNNLVKQQYYLLEKIEEQALYIIELNNNIIELNKQNNQLQTQINELNNRLEELESSAISIPLKTFSSYDNFKK